MLENYLWSTKQTIIRKFSFCWSSKRNNKNRTELLYSQKTINQSIFTNIYQFTMHSMMRSCVHSFMCLAVFSENKIKRRETTIQIN